MAEMFVSPLVSLLIENLAHLALSFKPSGGNDRKLKQMTDMLVMIEAVLEDAENRQIEQRPIQLWLHDVQKLAYEIEDVVDDLTTEAQRRQTTATPESSRSGRLRKFTSRFRPTSIGFNYDMDRKIGQITNRLQELEKTKNTLLLQKCGGDKFERTGDLRHPLTSASVDPARVYGREEESAAILTLLLEDRASDDDGQFRVISIVGMGGIGKTTLAQSLYNNERVKKSFPDRAWVCVTQDFNAHKICKIIFEEVYDQSCTFNELNKVQEKLREKLSKKKFLIVFDDVWNEDYVQWDVLSNTLRVGAPGSTIVVTSRSKEVAKIMGSKEVYDLKVLSDGDCLSLLAQHAFERPNFDGHPEFKEVGEVIAKRCKGLPLAAMSLGGLLRAKQSPDQWREVSTSKIWELRTNNIIPVLRLSYHQLPPYLKPLFVYCSLFPKGYEFDKQELIMLWMAQGFLRQSGEQRQMEELGCEYFGELISRSFFQQSTGNKSRYMMHDLNNDLAQFVAGQTSIRLDNKMVSDVQYKVSEEPRHASFISHKYDDFKKFKALNAARCLRTLLLIKKESYGEIHLSSRVIKEFPRLPCLRALSFKGYRISELPISIGNLNLLRYLDLSHTKIKGLPKSVCALSNLQTLLLHGCRDFVQFPASFQKLINLRHLDIVDTPSLKETPLGIGLLTRLHTLSKFIVDRADGRKITELKGLHHLQGTLSIIGMENVMNVQEAMEANLFLKEGLHELEIKWNSSFGGSREGIDFKLLDALKSPTGLTSLKIEFYGGQKFPSWVGDQSFCNMVEVRLNGCKNITHLPPLGQLTSLKELSIEGMDGVKVVGMEFIGTGIGLSRPNAFQSLKVLSFSNMEGWEEWSVISSNGDENLQGAFPCLQELEMSGCMKLNKISLAKIPSLESLEINGCSEMILRSMGVVGSVKKLRIWDMSGLSKLDEGIIGCLGEVEDLSVVRCKQMRYLWDEEVACQVLEKLKSLCVDGCEQVESLGDKEQLLPHNLESLELLWCDKLEKMPNWQNNLTSLRQLSIQGCKQLQNKLGSTTNLEPKTENRMAVDMAQGSNGGKHGEYEFSNLESIYIWGCPSLKWFPTGKKLPTTLRYLDVSAFENMDMEDLAEEWMHLSLLESVSLRNWSKLKSLPQGLIHLTRLDIHNCSGIESIPQTCLPPTLITLEIEDCSNLKYMLCANEMQSLTSLQHLIIMGCENLEGYPSGGVRCWPPNLKMLIMGEVKQPIIEWGLATLPTSLLDLQLYGEFPQLISFSVEGTQLPRSLVYFLISSLKNLESLGKGLEHLSSLQDLHIKNCHKLRDLPQTLLPNLSRLQICKCPLLEERCKKEKRDYWPKISHIPFLKIGGQFHAVSYLF